MKFSFQTSGTCSSSIDIETTGDTLTSVTFHGGCDGNLKGISKLVANQPIQQVIHQLEGIKCGKKSTSCPDQLARALKGIAH